GDGEQGDLQEIAAVHRLTELGQALTQQPAPRRSFTTKAQRAQRKRHKEEFGFLCVCLLCVLCAFVVNSSSSTARRRAPRRRWRPRRGRATLAPYRRPVRSRRWP